MFFFVKHHITFNENVNTAPLFAQLGAASNQQIFWGPGCK